VVLVVMMPVMPMMMVASPGGGGIGRNRGEAWSVELPAAARVLGGDVDLRR
jgi:hypothetical protein